MINKSFLFAFAECLCLPLMAQTVASIKPPEVPNHPEVHEKVSVEPTTQQPALSSTSPWEQPLVADAAIRSGTLANGMHYYVYPMQHPSNSISLQLLVQAGALMETDAEDGLAHFIEHMVFCGSRHFEPKTLVHFFQKNGMNLGPDSNAYTGWFHTCYLLDLPNNEPANLQKALTVLNDFMFEALFPKTEIEREREVILSEKRLRDSIAYRASVSFLKQFYPEHSLGKRFVIGTEKVIQSVTAENFFKFYKQWYTPNRMALIIAGNIDADKTLTLLQDTFKASRPETPTPNYGTIKPFKKIPTVSVYSDKELPEATVLLAARRPLANPHPSTLNDFKYFVTWSLMSIMLNQRLNELVNTTDLIRANFEYENMAGCIENTSFSFSCAHDHLLKIVPLLEQTYRSVHVFGFSEQELAAAKAILGNRFKTACISEKNETPKQRANRMCEALSVNQPIISAPQQLTYFQQIQSSITPQTCKELWDSFWKNGYYLFAQGSFDERLNASALEAAFAQSQQQALQQPNLSRPTELKSVFPSGHQVKITNYVYHPDLQLETFTFDNNVRVNLRHTTFEKEKIDIHVAMGCGLMEHKHHPSPGLNYFLNGTFIEGGIQQYSKVELDRLFEGKPVSINFSVNSDCYALSGHTNQRYLSQELQLIGAYLLQPGYRAEGEKNFRKHLPGLYESFKHDPFGVMQTQGNAFITNNDMRIAYPTLSVMQQRTTEEARALLEPVLQKQYMELTIVGDFDRNVLLDQLFKTFGQLPAREATKHIPNDYENTFWPTKRSVKVLTFQSTVDEKAMAVLLFPCKGDQNPVYARKLAIIASIISHRLYDEIREDLGDCYTANAWLTQNEIFNRGAIFSYSIVTPQKLSTVADRMLKIADDIAHHGATQDELNRAIKPMVGTLEKARVTNGFWMNWISGIQANPHRLTWDLANSATYSQVTLEEINEYARDYLNRGWAISLHIQPEKQP